MDSTSQRDGARLSFRLAAVMTLYTAAGLALYYGAASPDARWIVYAEFVGAAALFFSWKRFVEGVRFSRMRTSLLVFVSAIVLLVAMIEWGRGYTFRREIAPYLPVTAASPVLPIFYFAACSLLARALIPVLLAKRYAKLTPAELGWLRAPWALWKIYVALLLVMIPLVVIVSAGPEFTSRYPQAREIVVDGVIHGRYFVLYHVAYFAIFLSGESFWRGYMIFGCERELGRSSIALMASIYSLAHFGKAPAEAAGAIVAAFVLGYLALKHRSFLLGVAVHWSVALTMDLSVIARRGLTWSW